MPIAFRPARADELQHIQELIVTSINDLTERHGFGAMATVRPAAFQLFSFKEDPRGLWVAEALRGALRVAAESGSDQVSAFLPGTCEAALRVAADHRMRMTFPMVLVSDRAFGDWTRYLPRNPGFM